MKESIDFKSYRITWEITLEDNSNIKDNIPSIMDQLCCLASCIEAREDLLIIKDIDSNNIVLSNNYQDNV